MLPIEFPFDVTDTELKEKFITEILLQAIASLKEAAEPQWGKMTAQHHMVEHLVFAFRMSTDKLQLECKTPAEKLDRMQTFLSMNRPMPKGYINPVAGDKLLDLQYESMDLAKKELKKEVQYYLSYYEEHPDVTHTNPTFGELDAEDWQKFHFKHCFHHLSQFGLIEEK